MSKNTNLTFGADGYTKDLKVYDSEYLNYSKKHKNIGKSIEVVRKKYIDILKTLSTELEGQLSDNIYIFAEEMDMMTKDVVYEICKSQCNYMNNYISEIDEADKAFF